MRPLTGAAFGFCAFQGQPESEHFRPHGGCTTYERTSTVSGVGPPAGAAGDRRVRRRRASLPATSSSPLATHPRPSLGRLALAIAKRRPLRPTTPRPAPLYRSRVGSDRGPRRRVQARHPAVLLFAHRL